MRRARLFAKPQRDTSHFLDIIFLHAENEPLFSLFSFYDMSTESPVPNKDIRIICGETDGRMWTASAWRSAKMIASGTARTEDAARGKLQGLLIAQSAVEDTSKNPTADSESFTPISTEKPAPQFIHAEQSFGVTMDPSELTDEADEKGEIAAWVQEVVVGERENSVSEIDMSYLEEGDNDGEYVLPTDIVIGYKMTTRKPLKIVFTEHEGGTITAKAPELGEQLPMAEGKTKAEAFDALINRIAQAYSHLINQCNGDGYDQLIRNLHAWFVRDEGSTQESLPKN